MFQYVDTNIIIFRTECTETVETPKYRRPARGAIELMKCAHSQKYNYSGANGYLVCIRVNIRDTFTCRKNLSCKLL